MQNAFNLQHDGFKLTAGIQTNVLISCIHRTHIRASKMKELLGCNRVNIFEIESSEYARKFSETDWIFHMFLLQIIQENMLNKSILAQSTICQRLGGNFYGG